MAVMTDEEAVHVGRTVTGFWWLFLVTGILWTLLSFVILGFDPTSAATIGILVAVVLLLAGLNEFVELALVDGWKWLHGLMGVIFIVAGIMALMEPFQTFGILALLVGWYLLFKGLFTTIIAIAEHREMPLWGLALAVGLIEMAVGIWAIGYPGRSAWLLILWVGIGALMRGITEIVVAFKLRGARHEFA